MVATADAPLVVPPFATSIIVKAWGAGGGGNDGDKNGSLLGAAGGAGGFASGVLTVAPSETLSLQVGGGGPFGAGGGYSGVFRAMTPLVIAGGGGGATPYYQNVGGGFCQQGGTNGHAGAAGGGLTGEVSLTTGAPGTATAGGAAGPGAAPGTALAGGSGGKMNKALGGKHGGGSFGSGNFCGTGAGGGGGGGWIGGSGGYVGTSEVGQGGGGGSGYVEPNAKQPILSTGKGATPTNGADPDAVGAGAGGAFGFNDCSGSCVYHSPTVGADGRIVVRLPKP